MSLAVTTRTGIARVTFPQSTQSNLLFKVGGSINPVSADQVRIVGDDEIEGQVTSGQFCGTGNNYTVHFVAAFEQPFTAHGTWTAGGRRTPVPAPARAPAAAPTSASTRTPPTPPSARSR